MATYSSARLERGPGQRRGEPRRPGQWKLAYADFLTALMAFFLMMWLSSSSSENERAAIAAYFSGETVDLQSAATMPLADAGSQLSDLQDVISLGLNSTEELAAWKNHAVLSTDNDALRIDLGDRSGAPLFNTASGALNAKGEQLVAALGAALKDLSIAVSIEGHTDAFQGQPGSNWRLSMARAEAVRLSLQKADLPATAIVGVAGYADRRPLLPTQPHAAMNRRVSLLITPTPH